MLGRVSVRKGLGAWGLRCRGIALGGAVVLVRQELTWCDLVMQQQDDMGKAAVKGINAGAQLCCVVLSWKPCFKGKAASWMGHVLLSNMLPMAAACVLGTRRCRQCLLACHGFCMAMPLVYNCLLPVPDDVCRTPFGCNFHVHTGGSAQQPSFTARKQPAQLSPVRPFKRMCVPRRAHTFVAHMTSTPAHAAGAATS